MDSFYLLFGFVCQNFIQILGRARRKAIRVCSTIIVRCYSYWCLFYCIHTRMDSSSFYEMIITNKSVRTMSFKMRHGFAEDSMTPNVSNIFTMIKAEDVNLLRRDFCLHCLQQLHEHPRSQTIASPEEPLDGWDGVFFPY